ncbi:dipeptide epimerase [Segetibacter sp. 3557_3]|uniref:mandelate racemase/muconate lactonizing enzyme family protein n=1 Tax=Segetibacter sp. 3557_3 TaxID=2547429 RepID=UPI001058AE51|nr:dipeptide epimerase [Segetibacter sp. 3557_3]TDH24578.1 dipeptide epimerase [Segetibacter sp. 3557_3]
MKIRHTDIVRFSIPMEPFTIATGTMKFAQNVLIRIHTEDGLYGLGECSAFPMIVGETQDTCLALAKDFAAIIKGKDAADISARMKEINDYCAYNTTIKSAFDMALYDLAAKSAGKPLYQYLGGTKRTVETDITIGIGTPGEMSASALKFKESGASILKIKIGKKVNEDIDRVSRIREAVGAEMTLRLDANQGWTFDEAVTAFDALQAYNIEFCEQPLRAYDDGLLPALVKRSPVKIMADESCYDHHDAKRLIAANACDSINIKLAKTGGISEALKIQELAAQASIPCMMGGMLESRLALSAKLHVVYASPAIQYFDLDTCMVGHLEDPITGGVQYHGYFLDIDDTPGIGADVDEAFLKKCENFSI